MACATTTSASHGLARFTIEVSESSAAKLFIFKRLAQGVGPPCGPPQDLVALLLIHVPRERSVRYRSEIVRRSSAYAPASGAGAGGSWGAKGGCSGLGGVGTFSCRIVCC